MLFLIAILLFSSTIHTRTYQRRIQPIVGSQEERITPSAPIYNIRNPQLNTPLELYLELMKQCVTNTIYQDASVRFHHHDTYRYNSSARENGTDWPQVAHTMIGLHRLDNIQFCIEDVLQNNIPGGFIETGVWRGGATIFMRAILKAYNITNRRVFIADSFEGLPPSNPKLYPADQSYNFTKHNNVLAISLSEVQSNFTRYGLLDSQVVFLKGWFKDTLPTADIQQIAVMRLDGDLYESTWDALINLYHKLSIGGYIIIDNYYHIACCKQAVNDFREKFNITEDILQTNDHMAAYWQKTH